MDNTRAVDNHFVELVNSGNLADAFMILNEDGHFTVIGRTPVSGTYRGRAEMFEKLYPFMGLFVRLPTIEIFETIVENDRAVLLARGSGQGRFGVYEQPHYAWVARVSGDGFSELSEFMDTGAIESAVYGRKLVPLQQA